MSQINTEPDSNAAAAFRYIFFLNTTQDESWYCFCCLRYTSLKNVEGRHQVGSSDSSNSWTSLIFNQLFQNEGSKNVDWSNVQVNKVREFKQELDYMKQGSLILQFFPV